MKPEHCTSVFTTPGITEIQTSWTETDIKYQRFKKKLESHFTQEKPRGILTKHS